MAASRARVPIFRVIDRTASHARANVIAQPLPEAVCAGSRMVTSADLGRGLERGFEPWARPGRCGRSLMILRLLGYLFIFSAFRSRCHS